MLRIRDDVYLGLKIGGMDFPIQHTGFVSLKIIQSLDIAVPMMSIELVDSLNYFTQKITLADGVTLQITLGQSEQDFDVMDFRVNSIKDQKAEGAARYLITGYLDVPLYYLATANKPVTGTSTQALKYIAGISGMAFRGDNTADSQVWIPRNDRYCVWASKIRQSAWRGAESFMKLGITPRKEMRYRDVMSLDIGGDMPSFVNSDPQVNKRIFQMLDYSTKSRAGFNNINGGGYGHRLVVQRVSSDNLQEVTDKVKLRRFSPFLEVSKAVRNAVQSAPGSPGVQQVEFAPIDCGNTHDRYWEAQYQNKRLARLFSMGANFMTDNRTKVDLLEPVRYLPSNAAGAVGITDKDQVRGIYVVTAKSIKVQMGNYVEVFEALTTGSNRDPSRTATQE